MRELLQQMLKDLISMRHSLQFANDNPNGGIVDTIWMLHDSETLFDFMDDKIAALEAELAKPVNEFHPDWDTLKPYHDRIAELEAQIAKPEQVTDYGEGFEEGYKAALAQPEQYDQTTLELCDKCGWKTLIPDDCCLNCERNKQPNLREAAEMLMKALDNGWVERGDDVAIALRQALAQPEHSLDKKADNARELGLDYEPEQSILICSNCGADRAKEDCKGERTYCPFAGQAQQDHGFDRTASHMAGEYVDTAPPKQWVGLTDDEILSFVAFEPHPLMNKTSIIHAVQAKLREKNG